jgi:type I restriction-modification system DNA methylase subunit
VNACLLGNPRHALPSRRTHPLPDVSFDSLAVTPHWSSPQAPAWSKAQATTFLTAEELSRIVDHAELKKNDYNISPSRYIHTSDAETYRPIAEIVEELKVIEAEARETDRALKEILEKLGV